MTPQVWVRNPYNYIREAVEVGVSDVVWDEGILLKRRIEPYKFMSLYYGTRFNWKGLIVGQGGAIEFDNDHPVEKPISKYPTWAYGDSFNTLQDIIESSGENELHKVIITYVPAANTGLGKAFYTDLSLLQEDNPHCTIHIHGIYSYRVMFGLQFKSVDIEPRHMAARGEIFLPSGGHVKFEKLSKHQKWIALMGMRPVDLKIPRNRCMYNIKSALWAAENFKNAVNIKTIKSKSDKINSDSSYKFTPTRNTKSPFSIGKKSNAQRGDKFLCDMCSLQIDCRFFREGAVCIVPESEPLELSKFFKTRDSDTIIEGLGTLLASQTHRLKNALEAEEEKGVLHSETTRIINTLFDRGVALAKLVDPNLASAGATRINLTQNNATIQNGTPQALMSAIVEEFVKRGISRNQITSEMVMRVLQSPDDIKKKAIEVAVVEKINSDDEV